MFENLIDEVITAEPNADITTPETEIEGETQQQKDVATETAEVTGTEIEETEPTTTQTAVNETIATSPFIKVKHDKSEIDLSEQEAIEAIQLGLFAKDNKAVDFIRWGKKQAQQAGYESLEDYQKAIQDNITKSQALEISETQGIPEEIATELVRLRQEKAATETLQKQQVEEQENLSKTVKEVEEFNLYFPEVKVNELPKEVLEAKAKTPEKSLLDVYLRYSYKQTEKVNKVQEQQTKNELSATGSLTSGKETDNSFWSKIEEKIFNI